MISKENLYKIKKGILGGLVLSMLAGSPSVNTQAYSKPAITITVDDYKEYKYKFFYLGTPLEFNESTGYPLKKSKKIMIPLSAIANAMQAEYTYNAKTGKATLKRYGITWTATKDAKKISKNDHGTKSSKKAKVAAAENKAGDLCVEASAISPAFP